MIKNWLPAIALSLIAGSASSQTLFTYGPHKADAKEFVKAFDKNNQQSSTAKSKAMREYLDLYINSRLKIRQAYDLGYDTLPQIKAEAENLRNQIVDNYMSDPDAISRLTKEAFQRSQKDIHAAHIFIAFSSDTTEAGQKLATVQKRLAKGDDFMLVAQQLSDDPAAKTNKGDLDYITVFTLPYEFENILYSTPAGRYSKPYTSKAGYHIFKNLGERKAAGKMKIQQILLAFPPEMTESDRQKMARLADSLYQRINKGDDFGQLAATFSNDYGSAARQGSSPDVAVGQYEPVFEKTVWSLSKDGAISKPFTTEHGYHIVKRTGWVPVVSNPADKENNQELEMKVKSDDRWKTAKDFIYARVKANPGFQHGAYSNAALWAATDSLLAGRPVKGFEQQAKLFHIGDAVFHMSDWIQYAQMYRYMPGGASTRPYPALFEEFSNNSMYQYYRDHLEDYNEEFRNQMAEFRDGNLFFEIMQREVWNRAQTDSAALLSLYEKNKAQYNWQPSADAVIFFSSDQTTARSLADELKKNPAGWKILAEKLSDKIVADSSRYEWTQLPGNNGKNAPKPGTITPLTVNQTDNTASFAYIIKVYPQPGTRSFNEARGLVMNDYQVMLEEQWTKELRKKYPVVVDEKVLGEISK